MTASTSFSNPSYCMIDNVSVEVGRACIIKCQLPQNLTCENHLAFAFSDDYLLMTDGTDRIIQHNLRNELRATHRPHEWFVYEPMRFEKFRTKYLEQQEAERRGDLISYVVKNNTCDCRFIGN